MEKSVGKSQTPFFPLWLKYTSMYFCMWIGQVLSYCFYWLKNLDILNWELHFCMKM